MVTKWKSTACCSATEFFIDFFFRSLKGKKIWFLRLQVYTWKKTWMRWTNVSSILAAHSCYKLNSKEACTIDILLDISFDCSTTWNKFSFVFPCTVSKLFRFAALIQRLCTLPSAFWTGMKKKQLWNNYVTHFSHNKIIMEGKHT